MFFRLHRFRFLWLSCLALALCTAPPSADAQPMGAAFEQLVVQVGGTANMNRNDFHRFWHPGRGGEATITTPFYFGTVETGLTFHRYAADAADVPSFDAFQLHLGWGVPLNVTPRFQIYTGFRLGNYYMMFGDAVQNGDFDPDTNCGRDHEKGCGDDPTIVGGSSESEFFMGLNTRLHLRATEALSFYLSGHYLHAYTHERLRLAYLSAGLSFTLQTPGWLRALLR